MSTQLEWQLHGENEWVLGTKIRGMVRNFVAEVYFDEDKYETGGWIWFLLGKGPITSEPPRGQCTYLWEAVNKVEAALRERGELSEP